MRIDSKLIPPNIARLMSDKDKPKEYKSFEQAIQKQIKTDISDEKSEKVLQEECASELRKRGIPFYRSRMDQKTSGTIGWPDFTFPYAGRFYGVECKVGNNQPSKAQNDCLDAIVAHYGIGTVVYNIEQFRNLLT